MMMGSMSVFRVSKLGKYFLSSTSHHPNYIPLYNNLIGTSSSTTSPTTNEHSFGPGSSSEAQRKSYERVEEVWWIRRLGLSLRYLSIVFLLISFGFISSLWFPTSLTARRMKIANVENPQEDFPGACNPFVQPGYLNYSPDSPLDNNWVPFEKRCPPTTFLKTLMSDIQAFYREGIDYRATQSRALPWMVNRTVVLIGDSIERFHARDFCDLISAMTTPPFQEISENGFSPSKSTEQSPSQSFFVSASSTLKPDRWYYDPNDHQAVPLDWPEEDRQMYLDHHEEWADRDNIRTSPWICEIPSYGFRIVTLFSFGIEPYQAGRHYVDSDWFIPPSSFIDRFHHILLPLLKNLSKEREAPHIMKPDLIEVSSGLWDLRQWTEEDGRVANVTIDDSTEMIYQALDSDRLEWWKERVIKLLVAIDDAFSDNSTSTMLWRTLHHTLKHANAPYSRVEQLDQFGRYLIENLKRDPSQHLQRLAGRLKIDTWGIKMLGQESHFRDAVHPQAIPGSVLWAEMMLWQVRLASLPHHSSLLPSRPISSSAIALTP